MDRRFAAFLAVSIAGSICLLCLGLYGDRKDWWSDWSFDGNVLAGATGALFGIPFAAIVLGWFLRNEDSRRERRHITRAAIRSMEQIIDSCEVLENGRGGSKIKHDVEGLVRVVESSAHHLRSAAATMSPEVAGLSSSCDVAVSADSAMRQLFHAIGPHPMFRSDYWQNEWANISHQWRIVGGELAIRAEVEGVSLIDGEVIRNIDRFCGQSDPPFSVMSAVREVLPNALSRSLDTQRAEVAAAPSDCFPSYASTLQPVVQMLEETVKQLQWHVDTRREFEIVLAWMRAIECKL